MRELSQAEYRDAFGTTDDEELRALVREWNARNPDDFLYAPERRKTRTIQIYRDRLPDHFTRRLEAREDAGVQYCGGFGALSLALSAA